MQNKLELEKNILGQLKRQIIVLAAVQLKEIEIEIKECDRKKEKIVEKYNNLKDPIKDKIKESEKKVKEYINQLQLFSTFDSKTIGNILQELISLFELEEYCYQETTFKTIKHYDPFFNREAEEIDTNIKMIVKKDSQKNKYECYNDLDYLVNNDQAIILNKKENKVTPKITFYSSNKINTNIEDNVQYGKFNYVKIFMDMVINFRANNNLNEINERELKTLLSDFLIKNKDLIQNNHQLRLEEKQKKINDDDFFQRVHQVILNWPEWKQEEYNNNFAISPYAKKINIKCKETKK